MIYFQRELHNLVKYAHNYHGELNEEAIKEYAKLKVQPEDKQKQFIVKLLKIVKKNSDAQTLSIYAENNDGKEIVSLLDKRAINIFNASVIEEYNQNFREELMEKLNDIYNKSLSKGEKKYFPILVANNYIKNVASAIKEKYHEKSLKDAIAHHAEEFRNDLDEVITKMDTDQYHFMSIDELKNASQNLTLKLQKQLADEQGVGEKTLSAIWRRILDKISIKLESMLPQN